MRARVLAALASGLVLACKGSAEPGSATATATAPASATATATASATAEPAPMETATVAAMATSCTPPSKPEEYCLGRGESPPKQIGNYKATLDANRCAVPSEVNDTCNGIHGVLSGPTLKGGKCCYSVCRGMVAPCGRLLLDEQRAPRQASVVSRADWTQGSASSVAPPDVRAAWRADALLEHASVAAFARFALELLAVGAPAELVAEAHRAALDEIDHARLAFALASAPGAPEGPSALDLAGIAPQRTLEAIASAAAEECCAGETFAALVAEHALANVLEPSARAALERIAGDEARHAELGWRTIGWAIGVGGESVRTAVHDGLARGRARVAGSGLAPIADAELGRRWGRLDAAALAHVRNSALAVLDDAAAALRPAAAA